MKKIFALLLVTSVIGFSTTSCKSKQKVVEISGSDISAVEAKTTPPVVTPESNERTIDESFRLAEGETNSSAFAKNYHVVVGSFSVQNNAKNLQRTLNNEGNTAIVVINEQGMYRVLIASYDEYVQARSRINQISNRFPDAWVLRQK
ncbi:MAG: SPOR domain-containing protein [Paludibacteraceae bacterium]